MKFEIEIDEEKLADRVEAVLVEYAVEAIRKEWGAGYRFRQDSKSIMREAIRANMDELSERAVAAAATSIANRAIKEKMKEILNEVKDHD